MSDNAINDKIQGSAATYLRCGESVNNDVNKRLLLRLPVNNKLKSVHIWQKIQAKMWLFRALCTPSHHTAKRL